MAMLLFLFTLISISTTSSANRVKRVLNGDRVLGRNGPYDAVRYTVGIGTMHGTKFYTFGFWEALKDTGVYGEILSTGALLTPGIVQTACHSVANFNVKTSKFANKPAQINHHWEDVRVVYVGINDRFGKPFSMLYRPPVRSLKFFIHKACVKLPDITQQALSHDFGYIKVDPSWISGTTGVPTTHVNFAPLYTTQELSRIFYRFAKSPPVCLNLGFGDVDEEGTRTDFLRAGWVSLLEYYYCTSYTTRNMTDQEISDYKTWVCSIDFPKFVQPIAQGDSGGPLTCDNLYFGVTSAYNSLYQKKPGKPEELKKYRVSMYSALVHAAYQNAKQYRFVFEEEVKLWNKVPYADIVRLMVINHEYPTFKPEPFNLDRVFHEMAIKSSSPIMRVPSVLNVLLQIIMLFICIGA